MTASLRFPLAVLAAAVSLLAVAVAAAPARAANPLTIGIADQHAATFVDARLTGLPVRNARLLVSWDAMRFGWQRKDLDAWMRAAKDAKMAPLVTFGPARRRTGILPSVKDYTRLTRQFRHRYPQVREYSPWNEPNISIRRRGNDPAKIAGYYRALRSGCPTCTVLGADVVDSSTMDDWVKAYLREFGAGRRPTRWGLHNYVDANSPSAWGTRTLLRLVPGQIWFTETGAVYRRNEPAARGRRDRRNSIRADGARSRQALERVFRLARLSPRIARVYVYHWRASHRSTFDSALISEAGTPRPSYAVFKQQAQWHAPPALPDTPPAR